MKKIVHFILTGAFLISGTCAYSSSFCPAIDEFSKETMKMQQKSIDMYKESEKEGSKVDYDPVTLLDESNKYVKDVVSGCVNYFKSTPEPDCSRFYSLSTAYIILGLTNKIEADKLGNEISAIQNVCPSEFGGFRAVQQQFDNRQIKY